MTFRPDTNGWSNAAGAKAGNIPKNNISSVDEFHMDLKNEMVKNFKNDGFYIAKGIINEDEIGSIFENVLQNYLKRNTSSECTNEVTRIDSTLLNQEMIKFREENLETFSEIYDACQSSVSLVNLITSRKISEISTRLLDCEISQLSHSGNMIRMDPPYDTRNKTAWHQEIAFVRNPGLVLWIPLVEMTDDIGPLHILKKSHLEGEIVIERNNINDYTSSRVSQTEIPDEILEKFEDSAVEIEKGDALFFDHKLIHKSGDNTSKRIRFSCQTRYMNSVLDDFASFRPGTSYNPHSMKRVNRKMYD